MMLNERFSLESLFDEIMFFVWQYRIFSLNFFNVQLDFHFLSMLLALLKKCTLREAFCAELAPRLWNSEIFWEDNACCTDVVARHRSFFFRFASFSHSLLSTKMYYNVQFKVKRVTSCSVILVSLVGSFLSFTLYLVNSIKPQGTSTSSFQAKRCKKKGIRVIFSFSSLSLSLLFVGSSPFMLIVFFYERKKKTLCLCYSKCTEMPVVALSWFLSPCNQN